MCGNNMFGGDCSWIIIILIILCCCGGNGCGNDRDRGCGCCD